jgi:hypothetical protein
MTEPEFIQQLTNEALELDFVVIPRASVTGIKGFHLERNGEVYRPVKGMVFVYKSIDSAKKAITRNASNRLVTPDNQTMIRELLGHIDPDTGKPYPHDHSFYGEGFYSLGGFRPTHKYFERTDYQNKLHRLIDKALVNSFIVIHNP